MGKDHYDTIVLGAGTAGCVLAARLSEDRARRVLLVEAGPDYPDVELLPPDIASALRPTYSHEWGYMSEPGVVGRSFKLPRGKIVGGCSATNATIALRGFPEDYDGWAAAGATDWAWDRVLPFFRRLERDLDFSDPWHGSDGPLPIRRYPENERAPAQRAFLAACVAVGFPEAPDLNAPDAEGAGPLPMNALGNVRQSAALTYLAPARSRSNLELRTGALVDKIIIERGCAVGVRLASPETTLSADQIVLAAGAYGSPSILMRSGVGPAGPLRALGIPVIADLPGVGQALVDHPLVGVVFSTHPSGEAIRPLFQTALMFRGSRAARAPDLQIAARSELSVKPEASPTGATVMLFVSALKPASRGRLSLRTTCPDDAPLIDPGYFTHPNDLPRLVEGLRTLRRIARTAPFSALAMEELLPGPAFGDSEAELARAVLSRVETYHHPVGTCRMGSEDDPLSVVDGRGQVLGVRGVQVADASIMPDIPSANTNLATFMLAERIAAWMRGEH